MGVADLVYGPFSEWHHWSPEGFAGVLKVDEDLTTFAEPPPVDRARVLANAFQWLFTVAKIVNEKLALGYETVLCAIREDYLRNRPSLTKQST